MNFLQMYNLDSRCQGGWFTLASPDDASWVEFWSGALQLWDAPEHCRGLRKGLPVAFIRALMVWHMTDTKLYVRGQGVTPVDAIVGRLERQRAEIFGRGEGEEEEAWPEEEWEEEEGDDAKEEEEGDEEPAEVPVAAAAAAEEVIEG